MVTKTVFTTFMGNKEENGDSALVAFLSGTDVPQYAQGKLFLNSYALNSLLRLIENPSAEGVIIRKKTPVIYGNYDSDADQVVVLIAKNNKAEIESKDDLHPEIYFDLSADLLTAAAWLVNATKENIEESRKLKSIGDAGSGSVAKLAGLFAKKSRPVAEQQQSGGKEVNPDS